MLWTWTDINCFKYVKLASLILWIPGCCAWKSRPWLSVNLLCLCFHPFYGCLSSFLPSRCSVHGADVCPGCWMKTSTSSPSLNSLVMCMLLQLTSSPLRLPLFLFSPLSFIPNHQVFDIVPFPCCQVLRSILDFIFKGIRQLFYYFFQVLQTGKLPFLW